MQGVLLLVRLPWGSREPLNRGVRPSGPEQPLPCFQFLLEMEGPATAAELGLFRCLLCAWETPSRLAVLQHPAGTCPPARPGPAAPAATTERPCG